MGLILVGPIRFIPVKILLVYTKHLLRKYLRQRRGIIRWDAPLCLFYAEGKQRDTSPHYYYYQLKRRETRTHLSFPPQWSLRVNLVERFLPTPAAVLVSSKEKAITLYINQRHWDNASLYFRIFSIIHEFIKENLSSSHVDENETGLIKHKEDSATSPLTITHNSKLITQDSQATASPVDLTTKYQENPLNLWEDEKDGSWVIKNLSYPILLHGTSQLYYLRERPSYASYFKGYTVHFDKKFSLLGTKEFFERLDTAVLITRSLYNKIIVIGRDDSYKHEGFGYQPDVRLKISPENIEKAVLGIIMPTLENEIKLFYSKQIDEAIELESKLSRTEFRGHQFKDYLKEITRLFIYLVEGNNKTAAASPADSSLMGSKKYGFFLFVKGDFETAEDIHSAHKDGHFFNKCPGQTDFESKVANNKMGALEDISNSASGDTPDFVDFIGSSLPKTKGLAQIEGNHSNIRPGIDVHRTFNLSAVNLKAYRGDRTRNLPPLGRGLAFIFKTDHFIRFIKTSSFGSGTLATKGVLWGYLLLASLSIFSISTPVATVSPSTITTYWLVSLLLSSLIYAFRFLSISFSPVRSKYNIISMLSQQEKDSNNRALRLAASPMLDFSGVVSRPPLMAHWRFARPALGGRERPTSLLKKEYHKISSSPVKIIPGVTVAEEILQSAKQEVDDAGLKGRFRPRLTSIVVGEDGLKASESYHRGIAKRAGEVGVDFKVRELPETTTQDELLFK